MTIVHQTLFDRIAQKYSEDESSDRFVLAWYYALDRVYDDLESPKVGLSLGTPPTDLDTDLDIATKYTGVLTDGINRYLRDVGEWGSESTDSLKAQYRQSTGEAHTMNMDDTEVFTRLGDI